MGRPKPDMSDSTDDRRPRSGRGSLLDHARDAGRVTGKGEAATEIRRAGHPSAGATPSMLSAPKRSVRVSTSRFADTRQASSEPAGAPLPGAAPAGGDAAPAAMTRPSGEMADAGAGSREKFGDRIARLIGTIAPDDKPAPLHPEAPEQHATAPDTKAQADPRPRSPEQQTAGPDQPQFPYPRTDRYARDDNSARDDHYHWHAASSGGQFGDDTRPLLDASILISAVWRFRRLIGAATLAGAVIGVLMALSTPHKYYAESRLFVDPREIRVTEDDIRNQQLSTEAMLAITDSQLQILSSTSVLEKVILDLGLDRDPEFNGSLSSGGIAGGVSLIRQLFTGKSAAEEGEQKALNNLREALSVFRDAKTFVIIVGVDTRDAEKSALIANQIVETYLDSEGQAQSSLLERTSESIDTRLNSLRSDLDAAEREVERFKAENGLVGVGGQYIDDKEILALSDQLANARAMKVGIRVKADNLARVKIDDVLSGAFPEELLSSNLSELRKQYTQTKSNAESLATRLGPRHPQYIAAMQSLETITNEISAELRRIVASSQTELQRAVETEQELASQMAIAKSRAMDQSVELVTLRELERKANATRGIYEAFLTRSRETSERSNLSTRNVRVISPAEAPIQPMGPSRKIIAIGGMVAGFFVGLGVALLVGAVESIRAYNGGQSQNRYPGSPFGGHPEPPAPGPRTPPSGPRRNVQPRFNEDMFGGRDSAAETPAPGSYSGARAQSKSEPGDLSATKPEPISVEPPVARPAPSEPVRTGFLRSRKLKAEPSGENRSPASSSQPARPAPRVKTKTPTARQEPKPAWLQAAAEILAETDGQTARDHSREQQPQEPAQAPLDPVPASDTVTSRTAEVDLPQNCVQQPSSPSRLQTAPVAEPAASAAPAPAPEQQPAQPVWQSHPAHPAAQAGMPYQPHFSPQLQPALQAPAPVPAHVLVQAPMQPVYPNPASYYPAPQPQHQAHYQAQYQPQYQPQFQPQLQASQHYVPHPRAMVDPYALAHPGYPAPAGHYAAAPVYPGAQPMVMPSQPYPAAPPLHPAYSPQQAAMPPQAQPYPAQPHSAVGQQPAQPAAAPAPVAEVVPAVEPAKSAQQEQPVSNEQVDRIRREMDELRTRIDGYGTQRRSA